MQPRPGILLDEISKYDPYPGTPPRPYQAFDFTSMLGQGQGAVMGNMFLQPLMAQLMGSQGMVPGQFQPTGNLLDRLQAQQFFQQQQTAMSTAAQTDRMVTRQQMSGAFNLMGVPLGQQQRSFIDSAADKLAQGAPLFAAMMPDAFDAMHGLRGSATVMAQQMHLGGRHMLDPVTGQFGMRGASAGEMTSQVYQELYGPGKDLSRMNGIGAGRAGQMFDEMAKRGFMGSLSREDTLNGMQRELGFASRQEMLQSYAKTAGLPSDKAMEAPEMQKDMRSFDAKRIAGRLQEMSGAVAAMRDIFGDMGQPDAPMSKLISGLDALTQGGLSKMSGPALESTVRQISNMARSSGKGMDQVLQMMAQGGQLADSLGLDRSFAVSASLGAVGFGQAYRNTEGNSRGFGKLDAASMEQLDQGLRLTAADSPLANQLGAAAKMVKEGLVAPGSDMHALVDAMKAGKETFTTKDGREVNIADLANDQQGFMALAVGSGMTASAANQLLDSKRSNQEYIDQDIKNFSRRAQGRLDTAPLIASAAATAITSVLDSKGFGEDERNAMMPNLTDTVSSALRNMKPEDRDDPRRRNAVVAKALREQLGEDAYQRLGANDAERNAMLLQMGSATVANLDDLIAGDAKFVGYRNHRNLLSAHSEETIKAGIAAEEAATFEGGMQSAYAALGQAGPGRRLSEALGNASPDTTMGEVLGKLFGGVDKKDLQKAMGPMAARVQAEQKKLKDMAEGTGDYKGMSVADRKAQFDDQARRVKEMLGEMTSDLEGKFGSMDPEAAKAMLDASKGGSADAIKGPGGTPPSTVSAGTAAANNRAGGGGNGKIEISGTLVVSGDGSANLVGTGQRGGAQPPGGG